ncbi:MAG: hypothetical protein JW880_01500 [Candidatus Thermoplasmatota archaeon]|nr:hypothetical protein [Candidatus Thermoplasmatota archaeon]
MMQIPPYRSLLVQHIHRAPAEAAKYVRTEFGDSNPSWLLAGAATNGHAKDRDVADEAAFVRTASAELPGRVLMRDGCGADH